MWTFKVAVAIGGLGVDANLRLMQLPTGTEGCLEDLGTRGVAKLREEMPYGGAIPVGARGGFGVNREIVGGSSVFGLGFLQGLRPKNLASTSFVAKLYSQDVDGQIPCRRYTRGSPLPPQVRARRTFHDRRPVQGHAVAVQEFAGMADRRDWGGGGDDPEESTQRMTERIWESLTDIQARMDQQAPVPPVAVLLGDGEAVPIAPVPPRVEVPFVAPVPPPVLLTEEPVMQVEKFLRLQPPTYSGGPNPDTTEHWVHEIERVFATMRCPAADRVVLAAYQLRGFALEWW
ncbi:hypothetical protein Taro_010456 [Colocasia esculenta]|uniref:Uncharacterized protein n=1 Tax=Colocasia esculenta TaxID=4460 RepID=A0A843U8A0_COLES|nr:hypothetical protein [Colocasia esculenta]